MARFKIVGNHTVGGVAPGKTVDLDESDPRTRALVKAGHLAPVKTSKTLVGETGPEIIKKGDR